MLIKVIETIFKRLVFFIPNIVSPTWPGLAWLGCDSKTGWWGQLTIFCCLALMVGLADLVFAKFYCPRLPRSR